MKKNEMTQEFDTSFLNNIQEFDDFNTDEVFSFDSNVDNTEDNDAVESTGKETAANDDLKLEKIDDTINPILEDNNVEEANQEKADAIDQSIFMDTPKADDKKIDTESNVENNISNEFEFPINFDFNEVVTDAEEVAEKPNVQQEEAIQDDGFKSFDDIDKAANNNMGDDVSTGNILDSASPVEEVKTTSIDDTLETSESTVEEPSSVDNADSSQDGESEQTDDLSSIDDDFETRLAKLAENTDFTTDLDESTATDINSLFVTVNSNVKEASDIFLKNVEMKKKIDERFEELKQLQSSIEQSKKQDYEEINSYKDKVIQELMEKKDEIEDRLNTLKELQTSFEKEKEDFEAYKHDESIKLEDLKREADVAFESHKEELDKLEDKLRKQKTSLEEERRQLSLDQIQYEADKNELANNMLKFNEIVGTFTDGVGSLNS